MTGAHNSESFGNTIQDIRDDGFRIDGVVESLLNSNSLSAKAKSSGILLSGLPEILASIKPDLVIGLGDREEPLITAIACNYLNIPFAHIAGGDRAYPESGDSDEGVRHATTKLAHLHFAMMKEHHERILRLGEEGWRVFTVGNPGLDRLRMTAKMTKKQVGQELDIDLQGEKNIVVIQHVINQEMHLAESQIGQTLDSLASFEANVIIIYPNSDPGSLRMIRVIDTYKEKYQNFHAYRNLPRKLFVNLLRNAGSPDRQFERRDTGSTISEIANN